MIRDLMLHITRFVLFVAVQVFILKKLDITFVNPQLYIMFVLMLPVQLSPGWLLISGFVLGITIDTFYNTQGLCAFATVFLSYFRIFYLRTTLSKDQLDTIRQPDIASTDLQWFLIYATVCSFVHHFVLFFAEVFTFTEILQTMLRVITSTVATVMLIMLTHFMFFRVRARS